MIHNVLINYRAERTYNIYIYFSCYRPTWPRGVQEVKAPRFLDTRHMKVVRSSPLSTGRLYPQEYPGTHTEMSAATG